MTANQWSLANESEVEQGRRKREPGTHRNFGGDAFIILIVVTLSGGYMSKHIKLYT